MIFVTTYKFKPHMTKAESQQAMDLFGQHGTAPGTQAHYLAADASGGLIISDNDDPAASYRNILNYGPFVEFDTKVMLSIEDAVTQIGDYLGS